MKRIIVLCTGNSCRSQMAEGYLRLFSIHNAEVYSAGIEAHGINSRAAIVMAEDGIDITSHTSNTSNEYDHLEFDFVITVCDNALENCPFLPGSALKLHHNFPDPAKATGSDAEILSQFRDVRDQIKHYALEFVNTYL